MIDLGGGTLVFDTSLTPRAARELAAEAEARTGRAPTLVANSHWHLDHLLGNQVFPGVPIYATRRTRVILDEQREGPVAQVAAVQLERDVHALEESERSAATEHGREVDRRAPNLHRHLLADAAELRLTPSNREFESRLILPGSRAAELRSYGRGRTESDAVLFLPEARTLFAADLVVVGQHPNVTSGNPQHWLEVLTELERLGTERIVPGHGPVVSAEALDDMREYLTVLLSLAGTRGTRAVPARFAGLDDPGQFDENLTFVRRGPGPRSSEPAGPS